MFQSVGVQSLFGEKKQKTNKKNPHTHTDTRVNFYDKIRPEENKNNGTLETSNLEGRDKAEAA